MVTSRGGRVNTLITKRLGWQTITTSLGPLFVFLLGRNTESDFIGAWASNGVVSYEHPDSRLRVHLMLWGSSRQIRRGRNREEIGLNLKGSTADRAFDNPNRHPVTPDYRRGEK